MVPIRRRLSDAVESGDLKTLRSLLQHCSVEYSYKLLLLAMRRKRIDSGYKHRELLKLLIDHGAKLDASDDNYSSLFDYIFRDLQKSKTLDFSISDNGHRGERQREDVAGIAALADDLKLLVSRGGADLTLSRVMDNQYFLGELQWTVRRGGSCGYTLLHFFLDQGMDPNFEPPLGSPNNSLLVSCIRLQDFKAAALLIEYGAWQSGKIVFSYLREGDSINWLNPGEYESLDLYLDSFNDHPNELALKLVVAKEKLLKRRQETYPSCIKPALAPAFPPSFDPAPIAAIISEYVL